MDDSSASPGKMLKKALGVLLMLAAGRPLLGGGSMFGSSVGMLLSGRPSDLPALFGGLLLGAFGAGLLLGGAALCGGETPAHVRPWKVLLFGLFFPGAAQAYAGRWRRCAFFLLIPWGFLAVLMFGATVYGVLHARLGLEGGGEIFLVLSKLLTPGRIIYGVLWVLSLADGWRWAAALPGGLPAGPIPRWRGPVFGLAVIAYSLVLFMTLVSMAVRQVLTLSVQLKGEPPMVEEPLEPRGGVFPPVSER